MREVLQGEMNRSDDSVQVTFIEMDDNLPSCSNEYVDTSNESSPFHIVSELKKSISNYYIPPAKVFVDDIQPASLNQFMDILKDLDDALDKSLAVNEFVYDSEDEDLVCKDVIKNNDKIDDEIVQSDIRHSKKFERGLQQNRSFNSTTIPVEYNENVQNLGRVKSTPNIQSEYILERNNSRDSMRHVEPLTLPVLLFFEHQIGTVGLSPREAVEENNQPLIVGRHTLLLGGEGAVWEQDPCLSDRDTSIAQESVVSSSSSSSSEDSPPMPIPSVPVAREEEESGDESVVEESSFGVWPHELSSIFACLSCTLGIFNISQFAIYSVSFGANFIVQFLLLSLILGLPLFTLYLCLGHTLTAGPIDMWKISPVFQGIGISMLIAQAVYGIYSIIGVTWLLVFLRDSFISKGEHYQWADDYGLFDDFSKNKSHRIWERVSYYFNEVVLQRTLTNEKTLGSIKFHLAFNLAVVWMCVFVALSKGLRSYGKAIVVLMSLPICGLVALSIRMMILTPLHLTLNLFSNTVWSEFFLNNNSWSAAAQVTFLTWGTLGPSVMQIISHNSVKSKKRKLLQRQSLVVVIVTCLVLLASGIIACVCVELWRQQGFIYLSGSFENPTFWRFMYLYAEALPSWISSTPVRYMKHYSGLLGVTISRPGTDLAAYSGWQPMRMATELMPVTLAGGFGLTPVWAIIFYLSLILFGISQQLAIWHCVITGVMSIDIHKLKYWESTLTFCSCVGGLALGLLFTTNGGIRCVYWFEMVCGAWWCCALAAIMCCAALILGRPVSAETLASPLLPARPIIAAILAFTWNVVLPVLLVALSIVDFRLGKHKNFYIWRKLHSVNYWPLWSRRLALAFQQFFIVMIPFVAFIQTWRYMSKGPADILERAQNLYRPRSNRRAQTAPARGVGTLTPPRDPPPRYTPPPSYSTATGLRHALRRTVRRFVTPAEITAEQIAAVATTAPSISEQISHPVADLTSIALETNPLTPQRRNSFRSSFRLSRDAFRRSMGNASRAVSNATRALTARSLSTEHLVRHASIR